MDTSLISKPLGEEVNIYAIDENTNIVPMNNLINGRFPTDSQPFIRLKSNDKVNNNIQFLISTPYMHHPENDIN